MFQNESELYPYALTDLSSKNAVVIAPHPDDECIGCGGSIVKHGNAGSRVQVVFLTNGDKGDFQSRFGENYIDNRKTAARKSMEILGVKDYELWGYEDRGLHLVEDEVMERLLHVVRSFSPSLLYAPSPYEVHPDHRTTSKIAMKLYELAKVTLLFYEVSMALFPNILVDITDEMECKKRAIGSYTTELHYNNYISKMAGLNKFRTTTLPDAVAFAEGFVMLNGETPSTDRPVQMVSMLLNS
jgi:LmbE family N-acetylglucosaminyl deacetylase